MWLEFCWGRVWVGVKNKLTDCLAGCPDGFRKVEENGPKILISFGFYCSELVFLFPSSVGGRRGVITWVGSGGMY